MTGTQSAQSYRRQRPLPVRMYREIRKNWVLYLLLLVPLTFLLVFNYAPMYGIQIAFKNYKVTKSFSESPWVGLEYFQKFFTNYQCWPVIRNTISLSLYSLATFPTSLILALMLNYLRAQRYKKTIQMVSYAPHFLSTVVMVGMILQFMDARTGIFNALLNIFGVSPTNYMAKPQYFSSIYIWSGVWQGVGYSSIIYIAALSSISPELHEAAIIDGANVVRRVWHIDIPGVLPTFSILLIMSCGSIMNSNFEKILLMQNNLNTKVSEVISTYTYKVGLESSGIPQYSYSTAIGLFTSVINATLLVIVNKISDRVTGSGLW